MSQLQAITQFDLSLSSSSSEAPSPFITTQNVTKKVLGAAKGTMLSKRMKNQTILTPSEPHKFL